jgi:hypothetical protein
MQAASTPSFNFTAALASGASPQAITSFLSSKGMGQLAQTYFNTNPANPNTGNNATLDPLTALKNYATSVGSDIKSGFGSAVSDLEGTSSGSAAQQAQGGFQAVGDVAGAAMSPLTEAIKGIANGLAETKPVQDVANSPAGAAITGAAANPVTDKLSQWAQQYPDAAKDLGALGNIAALGTSIDAAPTAVDLAGEGASKVGDAVSAVGDKVASAIPQPMPATPADSLDTAVNLTRGVQDEKYQLQAAAEDSRNIANGKPTRTSFNNGVLDTTKIAPSTKEVAVAKSIQPLVDSGEVDPAKDYTQNAAAIDKKISSEVARVRAGADAAGAKLEATPEDIKGVFEKTELPNKMGADEAQTRLAAKFQSSIMDLAAKSKDLLDFQQQFSKQAVKDFGQDVFTNPRNPAQEYLGELRNNFNDLIQSKFPDGKLPEGDTFKSAQKNISNMIQAKEGVIENGVRGNKVGSNKITRAMDKSPIGKALGRRVAMREASSAVIKGATTAGALGLGALGYNALKKK